MSQVETHLRRIAKACVDQWTASSAAAPASASAAPPPSTEPSPPETLLRVTLAEGGRRDGVSPAFFRHVYQLLTNMQCWTSDERRQPWRRQVVYEVPTEHLEKAALALGPHTGLTLRCDENGDNAELSLARQEPSLGCAVGVGRVLAFQVAVEQRSSGKHYLKPTAQYHKVRVESTKTWVFREHYDWHYTFLVKHREPYHDTAELMADAAEKSMTFCDPPSCHIEIACKGVKDTADHAYLADSLLCKVRDLLLPSWQGQPFHLIKDPKAATTA